MEALLAVLMTWLAASFGLPPADQPPEVVFVAPATMVEVRLARAGVAPELAARRAPGDAFEAVYDDAGRTVYLPEGWRLTEPADVSVLVHELVHHMQNLAGLRHACAAAREEAAYRAQARWLEMFDSSLAEAFGLDPMTLLVRTRCVN